MQLFFFILEGVAFLGGGEFLNGIGVDGVGIIFPCFSLCFSFCFHLCFGFSLFSSLFFVFLRFSSFFFAFLRFSWRTRQGQHNCNLLQTGNFTSILSAPTPCHLPILGNASLFTKFLFTIFVPLNPPPPNQQNDGFPLELLLKEPQTELRTLSQNCEQTLQKLRTNRITNKRAFLRFCFANSSKLP